MHGNKFMASRDYFEEANQRTKGLQARISQAVSAHYDPKTGRIVVYLSSKLIVSFSPNDVEGLKDARPSQLKNVEISPSGFGIHFPALDADLYVPGLLEGLLGSKAWMASGIGGGSSSSVKRAASPANPKLTSGLRQPLNGSARVGLLWIGTPNPLRCPAED